ncbi:hypothetical protein [Saccharothrix texasensis]|uniref:N-acetyltransferase domain-containing protein n=1 Tax=Saccharothrix texasensis TaxID=103734 RepID=A0A3N1HBD6_9PSEU|nr:hypothetical protein [Saccharothrix texasensis]ROP39823.1 hypothetical protein EDD40_5222 [Saccharothrix texasensis]
MDPLLPDLAPADDPYSFTEVSADDLNASWGALRTHSLRRHPGADLDDLPRRWPLSGAGDHDTAASVTVPSRAAEAAEVLARHGFAPLLVTAARLPGRGLDGRSAVRVVPLAREHLGAAVALDLETVRFDGRFGVVTTRPAAGGWASTSSRCLRVRAVRVAGGARRGVGAALADHAHRLLDGAGVGVTLPHHALPNPLSAPFRHSHGYRPLWTTWQRRPARQTSTCSRRSDRRPPRISSSTRRACVAATCCAAPLPIASRSASQTAASSSRTAVSRSRCSG